MITRNDMHVSRTGQTKALTQRVSYLFQILCETSQTILLPIIDSCGYPYKPIITENDACTTW